MALGGEDQNISFWCEKARALRWEKRREKEKRIRERKKKEIQVWNLYGIVWKLFVYEIHVWKFLM